MDYRLAGVYTNVKDGKEVFFVDGVKFYGRPVVLDDLNILVALATDAYFHDSTWSIEELAIYQGRFQLKEPNDLSIKILKQAPNQINTYIKNKITAMKNVLKDLESEYGNVAVSSITKSLTNVDTEPLQRKYPYICNFYLKHRIPEHTYQLFSIIAGE